VKTPPIPPAKGRPPEPPTPANPAHPATPGGVPGEAKLIRIEVYNKINKQISVRVNMPLAFAQLAMESLSDAYGPMIDKELKLKGVGTNLPQLLETLKKGGKQTLVEIENEEEHIKVWIE